MRKTFVQRYHLKRKIRKFSRSAFSTAAAIIIFLLTALSPVALLPVNATAAIPLPSVDFGFPFALTDQDLDTLAQFGEEAILQVQNDLEAAGRFLYHFIMDPITFTYSVNKAAFDTYLGDGGYSEVEEKVDAIGVDLSGIMAATDVMDYVRIESDPLTGKINTRFLLTPDLIMSYKTKAADILDDFVAAVTPAGYFGDFVTSGEVTLRGYSNAATIAYQEFSCTFIDSEPICLLRHFLPGTTYMMVSLCCKSEYIDQFIWASGTLLYTYEQRNRFLLGDYNRISEYAIGYYPEYDFYIYPIGGHPGGLSIPNETNIPIVYNFDDVVGYFSGDFSGVMNRTEADHLPLVTTVGASVGLLDSLIGEEMSAADADAAVDAFANALTIDDTVDLTEDDLKRVYIDATAIAVPDATIALPDTWTDVQDDADADEKDKVTTLDIPWAETAEMTDTIADEGGTSSGGWGINLGILNFFVLILFIFFKLFLIFWNCLLFIIFIFRIPAQTGFLPASMVQGFEYLDSIVITGINISLWDFMQGLLEIILLFSVIATLRRYVDRFHLPSEK